VLILAGNAIYHGNISLLVCSEILFCPWNVEAGALSALILNMTGMPPRPLFGWKYASQGLRFFIFIIIVSYKCECDNTTETPKEVDHVNLSPDPSDNVGPLEIFHVMDPNGPYCFHEGKIDKFAKVQLLPWVRHLIDELTRSGIHPAGHELRVRAML
jgi:hypothetical protein